ncbi:MAG TPA: hypothetical protein VJG90_03090 [Candidatus Nanoarchaeia archaeon]|nr:hypothetical protein [Candidatus Nanoarchaeia archaeon]
MKTVRSLFREVKIEIYKVCFLYSFLNAAIAFLVLQLILSFFQVGIIFPIIISILTFIASMIHYVDKIGFKHIEEGNPQIKEMLRTANDNVDQSSNILVQALFLELAQKMRTVSTGPLLQSNRLFTRIIIISILTFLIVFISSMGVFLDFSNLPFGQTLFNTQSQSAYTPKFKPELPKECPLGSQDPNCYKFCPPESQDPECILELGDDSVAKLSNEQINLELTPEMKEMDFNKEKDLEDKQFSRNSYPIEVSAQSAETLDHDIPKESELAKAYSLQVRGS